MRVPQGPLELPAIGFGTGGLRDAPGLRAVVAAVQAGFKLFDSAASYENEATVARAIAAVSQEQQVQVITKIRGRDHGRERTRRAVQRSLRELKTDTLDIALIHWPLPKRNLYVETFDELLQLQAEGLIQQVGVSNFEIHHLQRIQRETGRYPILNEVELHPLLPQKELRQWHELHGIQTLAWSPLFKGGQQLLEDERLVRVAARRHESTAETTIAWHRTVASIPIVKSRNAAHMVTNMQASSQFLDADDLDLIDAMDSGVRRGGHPDSHEEL